MKYKLIFIIWIFFTISSIEIYSTPNFSNIRNEEILNSESDDFAPYFYNNNSNLIFNSTISGKSKFYFSVLNKEFSSPVLIKDNLNSENDNQAYITFINDNEAIFSKYTQFPNRSNVNLFKISYLNSKFSTPILIENINRESYISQATTNYKSKYIYFVSNINTKNNNTDIFYALKNDNFGKYEVVTNINSPKSEITPFLKSEDSLYFSSNGFGGKGGFDIFLSVKENGIWQRPVPLSDLNTEFNETDFIIINDTIALFSSDRMGGKGKADIYSAKINYNQKSNLLQSIDTNYYIEINTSNDNIIINKSIEKYYELIDNNIKISSKVEYGMDPKSLIYNLEFSNNIKIDSAVLYIQDKKVNQKYYINNDKEIIIPLIDLIDYLLIDENELDFRLDVYFNGNIKSYRSIKNINENESIFNRVSTFRNQEFFSIEIKEMNSDIIKTIEKFLKINKFLPYALDIKKVNSNNYLKNYELLKTKLLEFNKNIIIESNYEKTILFFRNRY